MTTDDLMDKAIQQHRAGHHADAVSSYRQAVAINPDHGPCRYNLGQSLFQLGQIDQALEQFRLAQALDDPGLSLAAAATVIPGSPQADHWAIAEARRAWGRTLVPTASGPRIPPRPQPSDDGRIRVGYLSGFFDRRNRMKPVWGLINRHNRQRFEIHLFSDAPVSRVESGYVPQKQDRFHEISGMSNQEVAALIAYNGIQILVDLNGYSDIERLGVLALRPAPIIAAWFSMDATSGLDCYDDLIADEQVLPHDEDAYYTEEIVRVPGCYLTFEVNDDVPNVVEPPCVRRGVVTFGCLAPQTKITTQVVEVWAQILKACPGCDLVMKNRVLGLADNRSFVHHLFETFGVSPQRVRLEGSGEHLPFPKKYDDIDIALDTFPSNGRTTTMEALCQGVPVVTYPGDRWVSRISTSLMCHAGLFEFVAPDQRGYIQLAVELAGSSDTPDRLERLRRGMRTRLGQSPVCDTAAFAKQMEQVYGGMWARLCSGPGP